MIIGDDHHLACELNTGVGLGGLVPWMLCVCRRDDLWLGTWSQAGPEAGTGLPLVIVSITRNLLHPPPDEVQFGLLDFTEALLVERANLHTTRHM